MCASLFLYKWGHISLNSLILFISTTINAICNALLVGRGVVKVYNILYKRYINETNIIYKYQQQYIRNTALVFCWLAILVGRVLVH